MTALGHDVLKTGARRALEFFKDRLKQFKLLFPLLGSSCTLGRRYPASRE